MWQIAMVKTYSAVKIMTQAVSRQKNEILYLSPQANTWKFAMYNIGFYFEFEESERKNFNWPHFYQGSLHRAPFQPRWPSQRRQWRSQSRSKTPFEWFFAIFYLTFFGFSFLSFWSDRLNTRAGVEVCGFSKARHMRSRNVSRIMSPGDIYYILLLYDIFPMDI